MSIVTSYSFSQLPDVKGVNISPRTVPTDRHLCFNNQLLTTQTVVQLIIVLLRQYALPWLRRKAYNQLYPYHNQPAADITLRKNMYIFTRHNVLEDNLNVFVTVGSRVLVPEADHVTKLVNDDTQLVTVLANRDCLRSVATLANERTTPERGVTMRDWHKT
jgi:hypothetical protein